MLGAPLLPGQHRGSSSLSSPGTSCLPGLPSPCRRPLAPSKDGKGRIPWSLNVGLPQNVGRTRASLVGGRPWQCCVRVSGEALHPQDALSTVQGAGGKQSQCAEAWGTRLKSHSPNLAFPGSKAKTSSRSRMESPKQRPVCSTGSGATAPKEKTAEGFEAPGWHLVGPEAPVGRYPNIWCPSSCKSCGMASARCASVIPLGCFCSHHGSVSGAHSCLGTVCAHMASLPDTALPCPHTGGSAHMMCPE